jgi:2-C-methyl-D-erythritol 4-phosphate cytidylyltransferase
MIVVGGGSSSRFGRDKLMIEIDGRPLIAHTIDAVIAHVDVCVVVCRREIAGAVSDLRPDVTVTTGGATRTQSEIAGLAAIGGEVDLIGIHDAARPVVSPSMVERLFDTAHAEGGALPLLTYEKLILDRHSRQPIPGLHAAQTPQVFRAPELMAAYTEARRTGYQGHDTVAVLQAFGDLRIVGVPGDPANVKVTYPGDLPEISARLSDASRT